MNFLLLCIQSVVCVACIAASKAFGFLQYRDFDYTDAKKWFPISMLLVAVIYTGSKSLVRSARPCTGVSCQIGVNALRFRQSPAILEHPRLHYLQEPHYHPHCEFFCASHRASGH